MARLWLSARLGGFPWAVFLAGLLVRLLALPFAIHSDFIHNYQVSSCASYGYEFSLRLQIPLVYLQAAYLRLVSPLVPMVRTLCQEFQGFFASPADWYTFIDQPQIYRALFLLKLPYLLFDLGAVLLLFRLGSDRARSGWMVKFWMLHPLLLFGVYLFGRHETIAIFFIVLSLVLIERGRYGWGLLSLGVAIAVRYYALFLLPFYVLSLSPATKQRVKGFLIGLLPWSAANLLTWLTLGTPEVSRLIEYSSQGVLLPLKLPIAAWDNLYLFPLAYLLLLLHRLYHHEYGLDYLLQYSLASLLLLLATAYLGQSPHYWTWVVPLVAVAGARDRRLLPLHVAQVILLFVYSFIGSRATAGYLLASISPEFFWSLPSPIEVIGRFSSPETVVSLAHTALSAVTLWMAYLVLRPPRLTPAPEPKAPAKGGAERSPSAADKGILRACRVWKPGLLAVTMSLGLLGLSGCTLDNIAARQEKATGLWDELVGGRSFGQSFLCGQDNLYRIDLGTATYARTNSAPVVFHLKASPETQTDILTVTLPASAVQNERPTEIEFAPQADSAGKTYYFNLESPESTVGNAITVYASDYDSYEGGRAYLDGQPVEGDLVFAAYSRETFTAAGVWADFASRLARDVPFLVFYALLLLTVCVFLVVVLVRRPGHGQ